MLDLHTHSTASDGTLSPKKLIVLAKKIQLKAIALCDHDTTMGVEDARQTAIQEDIHFVPGVELSANHNEVPIHIVGLYIDHNNFSFQQILEKTRRMRNQRNPQIIKKLQQYGVDITMDELTATASGDSVGRPLIAKLLIEKKVTTTATKAFDKFLNPGGVAFVPKERLSAKEAISAIRLAGGVPILAHPHQTRLLDSQMFQFVGQLADLGLCGIEVFCSGYKTSMNAQYTQIAQKYNLVRSGGSDFHGANKPKIKLGRGMGSLYVRDDLLDPIRQRADSIATSKSTVATKESNGL